MTCKCGFSTEYPECNGTHKVVKKVKDKIIDEINKIDLNTPSQINAVGMKILIIDAINKVRGI